MHIGYVPAKDVDLEVGFLYMPLSHLVVTGAAVLGLVGCSGALGPEQQPASELSLRSEAEAGGSLVLHRIAPSDTDPDIRDEWLEDHYVYVDTAARSRRQLLIFMTGAQNPNSAAQLFPQEAALLGYHAIALTYPNSWNIGPICRDDPDPTCQERVRLEIIDGIDRTELITVTPAHSIDNRLTKLLLYLASHYPDEGWSRFIRRGAPRWSRIALTGWSFGGMQAALMAKLRRVNRVAMFSGTADGADGVPGHWVAPGATSPDRHYVLSHLRDPIHPQGLANWEALGMFAFGEPVLVEGSAPPYDGTHILVTDLLPSSGSYAQAHPSVVRDDVTPLAPDGTPLLLDAWRYMLTAR
jgi:hypothetical protein